MKIDLVAGAGIQKKIKPSQVVKKLGFPAPVDVEGHRSVAEMFPRSKRRCGLYLLCFANGLYYIGQAIDVVRRFAQHRKLYEDIVGFAFQPVAGQALDRKEKDCIWEAERKGLQITNRDYVSTIYGETDLDLLLSTVEQGRWLNPSRRMVREEAHNRLVFPEQQKNRYVQQFERLKSHPDFHAIIQTLRSYVRWCLPA